MITHVVLFRFKPENKAANLDEAVRRLRSMVGRVPTLRALEVGLHGAAPSPRACDLALVTRFDDWAGLAVYADHPAHGTVKEFLAGVIEASHVVDYESDDA